MKTLVTSKTSSKTRRYEKLFMVLMKYGFEDLLSHPPLNKVTPQTSFFVPSRNGRKISQYTRNERIRLVCEELGTTFIKFAQIASNRPDLLPDDLIVELAKLQDRAPAIDRKIIKELLAKEFGRPIEELVETFDEEPLACASMAQVHRAKLIGGQDVVLKIQRPEIKANVAADIAIMKNVLWVIKNYFPQYMVYQPEELIRMFEKSINEEISFIQELDNLLLFKSNFRDNKEVYTPEVYREFCTDAVLCMSYIEGVKVNDLSSLKNLGISSTKVASLGIELYFDQIFEHGFFHADPHPGNIFVLQDGRVAFLDFGMMGTLTESDIWLFGNILLGLYNQDVSLLKKVILSMSTGLDEEKERELEYDIIRIVRQYSKSNISDVNSALIISGLNALFYDYKIKIPFNLLLLLKTLVIVEGVGIQIDPQYNILKNLGPYAIKVIDQQRTNGKIKNQLSSTFFDAFKLTRDLAGDIQSILRKIKRGKLHIEFEHKGLTPAIKNFNTGIKILSYSMIIMGVLIASSLIIHADTAPKYYDIPVIALVGFATSIVLGLRIFLIIKSNKENI